MIGRTAIIIRKFVKFPFFIILFLAFHSNLSGQDPGFKDNACLLDSENVITLRNSFLEIRIRKVDGKLVGFKDRKTNLEFIKETDAWWSPFGFIYRIGTQEKNAGGWLAKSFNYQKRFLSGGLALDLVWSQFFMEGRVFDIKVTVTVELQDNSSLSVWKIDFVNSKDITLEQIIFPMVSGLGQLSSDPNSDYLAFPSLCGLLFQDPLHNFIAGRGWGWEMYYPSGYTTMQFLAYYGLKPITGLYLACQDEKAHSKFFSFSRPVDNWLCAEVHHILEFTRGLDFHSSYPIVLGVFHGDWYDAAQIYRDWALGRKWARQGPLVSRPDIPDWYPSAGLRQWISTHPNNLPDFNLFQIVPEVIRDTASFMKSTAVASWIGWERTGWYIEYPDVFPPKEGWAPFRQAVAGVHSNAGRVLFIPDTTSCSEQAPSWNLAKSSACRDRSGQYLNAMTYSESGTTTRLIPMCPATGYWQRKLSSLLTTLAQEKADVIQLDGFPIFGPQPCSVRNHGHPQGGGTWWFDNYSHLFRGFKKAARKKNSSLILISEGMAEAYLDLIEGFWNPFTTGWSPAVPDGMLTDFSKVNLIPLWHSVYHDYGLLESGIAFVSRTGPSGAVGYGDYRDFYIRGFALALLWGEMPTTWYNDEKISELDEQGERDMADYLRRIVEARTGYAKSFLVYGRMLKPLKLSVPSFLINGAKQIPYTLADYPPFRSPTVLNSGWKSPKGNAGIILTNISSREVSLKLPLTEAHLLFDKNQSYTITQYRNGTKSTLRTHVYLPQTLGIKIQPLDVMVLEVIPAKTGGNQ